MNENGELDQDDLEALSELEGAQDDGVLIITTEEGGLAYQERQTVLERCDSETLEEYGEW